MLSSDFAVGTSRSMRRLLMICFGATGSQEGPEGREEDSFRGALGAS